MPGGENSHDRVAQFDVTHAAPVLIGDRQQIAQQTRRTFGSRQRALRGDDLVELGIEAPTQAIKRQQARVLEALRREQIP